jgi:SAM-dependent methyltransferase
MNMPDTGFDYQSLELEQVTCPVCDSADFEQLATVDRYRMGISTSGCRRCGLVMTNPRPVATAMDDFYRYHYRDYYESVDVPDETYIKKIHKDERAKYTADFLEQAGALDNTSRLLDYGCGEGSLLRELATRHPRLVREAVEPGETFQAFAREYGSCTMYPNLESLQAASKGNYDLIVVNHVLEHIMCPDQLLADLGKLLSETGQIYIDVPAVEGYRSVASLHLGHMYHFSIHTLSALANTSGLRVESIRHHHPPNHPVSTHCLVSRDTVTPYQADTGDDERETIWANIRDIDRNAWKFQITSSFMYKAAMYIPRRVAGLVSRKNH